MHSFVLCLFLILSIFFTLQTQPCPCFSNFLFIYFFIITNSHIFLNTPFIFVSFYFTNSSSLLNTLIFIFIFKFSLHKKFLKLSTFKINIIIIFLLKMHNYINKMLRINHDILKIHANFYLL